MSSDRSWSSDADKSRTQQNEMRRSHGSGRQICPTEHPHRSSSLPPSRPPRVTSSAENSPPLWRIEEERAKVPLPLTRCNLPLIPLSPDLMLKLRPRHSLERCSTSHLPAVSWDSKTKLPKYHVTKNKAASPNRLAFSTAETLTQ